MPLIQSAAQCLIHVSRTFILPIVCTVSLNYAAIRQCIPTSKCLRYICRIDFFFSQQIIFQRTIKSSLSVIQAFIQTCVSVCREALFPISSVRSAESSSLGRRRPDGGPVAMGSSVPVAFTLPLSSLVFAG